MNLKNHFSLLILFLLLTGCKKYNCECISVYSNPPKGNISTSSIREVRAISKTKAAKTCAKYEDDVTTCQLK